MVCLIVPAHSHCDCACYNDLATLFRFCVDFACSAFTFWRVEFPNEMTGGFIPWDHMTTDTGMRVSVPIRLREVVSGAYLAHRLVRL